MAEACEYFKLYGGDLDLRYCDSKHMYHVRPARPGFVLQEVPDLPPGKEWIYSPSVTSVTRMLGGEKVNGLLWWAVNETLKVLDAKLEDEVVIPAVEQLLDCFQSRLTQAWNFERQGPLPASVVEGVMNSLDNCAGMDPTRWKALRAVAKDARDRTLDEAANLGNLVHNWINSYIRHYLSLTPDSPHFPQDPVAERAVKKFVRWTEDNDVRWLLTEQRVYSNKWHYTGTLDAVAEIKDVVTLVDFKTSKKVYDEHRFQTSAYVRALEEEFPESPPIRQRCIIRLSKSTGAVSPTILEATGEHTIEDDFSAFLGLRTVYRRLKGA